MIDAFAFLSSIRGIVSEYVVSGGDGFLWLPFVPYYTGRATAVCL